MTTYTTRRQRRMVGIGTFHCYGAKPVVPLVWVTSGGTEDVDQISCTDNCTDTLPSADDKGMAVDCAHEKRLQAGNPSGVAQVAPGTDEAPTQEHVKDTSSN